MSKIKLSYLVIVGILLFSWSCKEAKAEMSTESLKKMIEKLRPLHQKLDKPQPGDWLAEHYEPGQTFQEYLECNPVTPRGKRRVIYIQPLGDFTKIQHRVVNLTADFMGLYFNLPVKIKDDLPLSIIPERARRVHPYWRMKQILSTYVLDAVLIPRLPKDAAAYIAFTASDLWPGMGWNFVFGQASTRDRVGVWSIYRSGDPGKSAADFRLCLLRTMKTAVHETGHMFSLLHCTLYQCCMCGSNHREESDKRPITLCPECLAKLCWATKTDPVERYKKLAQFFEKNSFNNEAQFCKKSILILATDKHGGPRIN
jgi:archaemetzincin